MFEIFNILNRDRSSYLESDVDKVLTYWRRKGVSLFLALLIVSLAPLVTQSFLNTLISIFGILIGFGVSVLFYIADQGASISSSVKSDEKIKREMLIKIKRLKTMRDYVFYRMSYFVYCSITIIVVSVVIIVFGSISILFVNSVFSEFFASLVFSANFISKITVHFLLYFLVIESVRALYNLLGALIFYFNYRMKHEI